MLISYKKYRAFKAAHSKLQQQIKLFKSAIWPVLLCVNLELIHCMEILQKYLAPRPGNENAQTLHT
jgi:hypothetical protein